MEHNGSRWNELSKQLKFTSPYPSAVGLSLTKCWEFLRCVCSESFSGRLVVIHLQTDLVLGGRDV